MPWPECKIDKCEDSHTVQNKRQAGKGGLYATSSFPHITFQFVAIV